MSRTVPETPPVAAPGGAIYGLPPAIAWIVILFPYVASLAMGVLFALPSTVDLALDLNAENHLVENLSVVASLLGAVLAFRHALRMRGLGRTRAFLGFLALAAVCFLLGAEEVGWGQQIFHFRSPELMEQVNVQRETTIHNLPFFHDLGSAMPLVLAFASLVLIVTHTRRHRDRTGIPSLVLPYAIVIVLFSGYDVFTDWVPVHLGFDILIGRLCELMEMLFAFALTLGIWLWARRDARRTWV